MNNPKVIIWADPGGTTGLAVWVSEEARRARLAMNLGAIPEWQVAQVPACDTKSGLVSTIAQISKWTSYAVPFTSRADLNATVGFETFDFRMEERYRDKIDYTAGEVIGAIRLWSAERQHVKLVKSGAGLGKGFWSDDKIKKIGLYTPGQRHAMDALRHLLRYRLFTLNHQNLLMPFRPAEVEGQITKRS